MNERATLSRSQMSKSLSRWKSAPGGANARVSERHKELWHGIHNFVSERNGAVVSPMYAFPIRIEVEPDSKLPERLRELGYDPVFLSTETRIGAGTPTRDRRGRTRPAAAYGFRVCDVFQVSLPR
jgi:hypothetical protein